jgi:RNA polymerase sigma-70 factor, ECF subfamily
VRASDPGSHPTPPVKQDNFSARVAKPVSPLQGRKERTAKLYTPLCNAESEDPNRPGLRKSVCDLRRIFFCLDDGEPFPKAVHTYLADGISSRGRQQFLPYMKSVNTGTFSLEHRILGISLMSSRITRLPSVFPVLAKPNAKECAAHLPLPVTRGSLLGRLKLHLRTDEELIAELIEGESDALTVLFERHSALVFRIARRVLRNDAEAEDAVQQVFLDVFRSAEQFDPVKGPFKSWLLQFAYHRSFNSRRGLRARAYYDSDNIEDVLPQELLDGANHPFPIASSDVAILVDQVLKLVQPRQRRAIELAYYEGLTAEQTSEVTGESVRVVRHNIYRGLETLRSVLCGKASESNRKKPEHLGRTRG